MEGLVAAQLKTHHFSDCSKGAHLGQMGPLAPPLLQPYNHLGFWRYHQPCTNLTSSMPCIR